MIFTVFTTHQEARRTFNLFRNNKKIMLTHYAKYNLIDNYYTLGAYFFIDKTSNTPYARFFNEIKTIEILSKKGTYFSLSDFIRYCYAFQRRS